MTAVVPINADLYECVVEDMGDDPDIDEVGERLAALWDELENPAEMIADTEVALEH